MRVGDLFVLKPHGQLSALAIALAALLVGGCKQTPVQVTPDPPPPPSTTAAEVVEEQWPNGQLRLRNHVLRGDDGALVNHGSYERWHDNGEKEYEAVFVHGKKEGVEVHYHKNGRKWTQREFRNGKRHGPSLTWDESGELVKEENWADGKPHGAWTVWKHGEVEWRHTYEHGDPAP